jgi:hypothetical protein
LMGGGSGGEAARYTTGEGGAADDGHGRHRRRGEVDWGFGLWGFLCCAPRVCKFW